MDDNEGAQAELAELRAEVEASRAEILKVNAEIIAAHAKIEAVKTVLGDHEPVSGIEAELIDALRAALGEQS